MNKNKLESIKDALIGICLILGCIVLLVISLFLIWFLYYIGFSVIVFVLMFCFNLISSNPYPEEQLIEIAKICGKYLALIPIFLK